MGSSIQGLDKILAHLQSLTDTKPLEQAVTQACLIVEADAKRNCPVDNGRLRGSIESDVNVQGSDIVGTVGTNVEFAPYVEYGTGLFAEAGNGRKDVPWSYQDDKGNWHSTSGQHPQPFMHPAFKGNEEKIKKRIQDALREGIKK